MARRWRSLAPAFEVLLAVVVGIGGPAERFAKLRLGVGRWYRIWSSGRLVWSMSSVVVKALLSVVEQFVS
jgi:hypothetical protein